MIPFPRDVIYMTEGWLWMCSWTQPWDRMLRIQWKKYLKNAGREGRTHTDVENIVNVLRFWNDFCTSQPLIPERVGLVFHAPVPINKYTSSLIAKKRCFRIGPKQRGKKYAVGPITSWYNKATVMFVLTCFLVGRSPCMTFDCRPAILSHLCVQHAVKHTEKSNRGGGHANTVHSVRGKF